MAQSPFYGWLDREVPGHKRGCHAGEVHCCKPVPGRSSRRSSLFQNVRMQIGREVDWLLLSEHFTREFCELAMDEI